MKLLVKSCAVYTRKSTEEGLEQDFNTLDAQREACLSYIASQKAEGWTALPDLYDDGGYSGGNIERPALQKLLADIKAGKINTVVVYKIDRLTRSLMDFSKLVEIFDQYGVTFVSITQSFNTTTSMGRLTLNVLLSFAQFEREVIGERVRDKITASKKKGIWLGGHNPVGYERVNKCLIPKKDEIPFVIMLYERYIALLTGKLFDHEGTLYSPMHTNKAGKCYRYYVSQNLLQYRSHPKGLLARLPASEIEDLVRKTIADQFIKPERIAEILGIEFVKNYDEIAHILAHREDINIDNVIRTTIQKIVISYDVLTITINSAMLTSALRQELHLSLPDVSTDFTFTTSYVASRSKNGAIMIDGIHENLSKSDPFNRPEHEVQNWIKGVAWRGMYFGGKTLGEIASAERTDSRYIARLINESLTII